MFNADLLVCHSQQRLQSARCTMVHTIDVTIKDSFYILSVHSLSLSLSLSAAAFIIN